MNAELSVPTATAAPDVGPRAAGPRSPGWWVEATLRSYSQVWFSRSRALGGALLAATMLSPEVGLAGLLGALVSNGLSVALGLDRAAIRDGLLGYNGLLLCVVLAAFFEPSAAMVGLGALGCAGAVLLHVALTGAMRRLLALPALSLPFVAAGWVALSAAPYLRGVVRRVEPAPTWAPELPLPAALDAALVGLGAVLAVPLSLAGVVVLVGLIGWSRVAAVHAAAGATVVVAAQAALADLPLGVEPLSLSFNVVLTAVALGGVFFVPGPASLLLALLGAVGSAALTVGLGQALGVVGWPVLALPFNIVVLVTLAALGQRGAGATPRLVDLPGFNPEETLHRFQTRARRFHAALPVALRLPFEGAWVCTQGHDGRHTHQGAWRHGLDFELRGPDGRTFRGDGARVTDYHCYGRPVLAMAAGTVAHVVDGQADSAPGDVETAHSWGNVVVVQHGPALFSLVAHLQPRSVRVKVGEAVQAGQVLGRCGASGRAPVPHLHVQLQASALVGDATTPMALHGVTRERDGGVVVERELVPQEGDVVANLVADGPLVAAMSWAPGAWLVAEWVEGDRRGTQVLRSEVDLLGHRSLHDPESGARLWFAARDGRFVAFDHQGPRQGALFALYLAAPRLPLARGRARWTDHLDARRVRPAPLGWLRDAASVVVPPPTVPVELDGEDEGEVRITRVRGPGLRAEARLSPADGRLDLRVELDGRAMEVTCLPR